MRSWRVRFFCAGSFMGVVLACASTSVKQGPAPAPTPIPVVAATPIPAAATPPLPSPTPFPTPTPKIIGTAKAPGYDFIVRNRDRNLKDLEDLKTSGESEN